MSTLVDPKNVEEGKYMLPDLISGDTSVIANETFSSFTKKEIDTALKIILDNPNLSERQKQYLLTNSWRIHYRIKPPTISEFISEDWLGPTSLSVYPHIKQILTEYWQPDSPYRHMILAMAIGTGKSFCSTISSLYVTTHLWAMRSPKKFFGLAQSTSIVHAMISFTMEKAAQTLLQPFFQILLSSKRFHRVRQEEKLIQKQEEFPDKICWTSAGRMGVLQFYNDVHYILSSSPANLLGLNMISAILSEISFFIDKGFSPEYIWRIYQDSKARIDSRFGPDTKYFAGTILDSSPNDVEASPIDNFVFRGNAYNDPKNYIVTGPQWKFLPNKFPKWRKTGNTFPVFRGSSALPPKLISEEEIDNYLIDDIIQVPIDVKRLFEENTLKNVKDYAGWPSGSQDRLINNHDVFDRMFSTQLKNFYKYIYAPSSKPSKGLLWKTVVNEFFIPSGNGKYEFYRAPLEIRFLHVDQAESEDALGFTVTHPEVRPDSGEIIYVHDFTMAIYPGKDRINLAAIPEFIFDLKRLGGMNFGMITFDQYQSSTTIQLLKEHGFTVERLSVDRDIAPYYSYISMLNTNRIKVGRNIILKGNLKSIMEVRTEKGKKKIDHQKGEVVVDDGGDWANSFMGKNAKDLSDSACGSVWNAIHHFKGVPRYQWVDDSDLDINLVEIQKNNKDLFTESLKSKVKDSIYSRYGLYIND